MKKILAFLLALVMCLAVLTSCDAVTGVIDQIKDKIDSIINPQPPVEYHIDKAQSFLNNMYKNVNPVTGDDYEVVGQVRVAGVAYTVTWTSNTEEVKIVALENGNYLVDLNENSTKDVPYTLTATITAGNGDTATVVYERKVPDKTAGMSWEDYMKAKSGDVVIVKGIVVGMNGKSVGNSRNHLFLMDESGKGGYYSYQMPDDYDPVAKGVKVGMTVVITGEASPYSGMQEIKGGTFTIVDETIKTVEPVDITDFILAGNTDFSAYVALPVTIKGVTLGTQELETASSQYLNFTLGEFKSYLRTYVTDFPTTLDAKTATADNADKAAIDSLHAEHFGDKADVTGILILYSGNPYLIPMTTDCFTNFTSVEKTDAEKVAVEVDAVTLPEGVTKDTVLDLPLVGKYFDDVTISWTSDNAAAVVGEDGKLTITLGEDAVTVTLTATYKCGEITETKTYTIAVSAIVKTFNQVVDAPVAGNEYYFMMHQGNLNSDLFLTGEMSGYYYATSETVDGAAKVKVVDAGEGAYYLMVGEKYATIVKNGNYINAVFVEETPAGKFTWNAEYKTFVINVDGTDYIYGTKADGTYATMDKCKLENAANTFVANLVLVKMSTDGEVKMTADNMGLGEYAAGSTVVEGFTFGYTEIGNYGNGIQMRIKEGRAASIWNETEFSFPIKEIVLVFNSEKSTYDNTDAFKFTFGNAADALNYTTTLSTVKGEKTYTITPDSATYTYFKMELLLTYSFYWDSITVVLTEGNVVHEHVYESEVVAPKCEEKGYTLYTCKCGDSYKEDYVNATGHNFVDGDCTNCDVVLTNTTVAGAPELADGTWVVVSGTVVEINEAWNDNYKNITVTIGDGDATLYVYRLSTKVSVGDIVTITGKIGSYNSAKQIAQGATAVITGHTTPETPTHTCESVCPTCQKCTDAACTESVCAEKCEGHEPVVEEPETGVVDPVVGTAYKFGMVQGKLNDGKVYYLKGGMNGYYMDTTSNYAEAIDVYIETAEGGYYLYCFVGTTKTYINCVVSGTHVNGAYEATASTVYTYDAESKTLIADVDGTPYWFGTRNDKTYTTVGPCAVSYKGFYCQFYAGEPEVVEPAHTCESKCDTCGKCTDAACTESVCAEKCEGHTSTPDAESTTISFADKSARTEFSNDVQVWANGAVTVTNNKASSTSNIGDYANPVRFYKSTEVVIECEGMTSIVFNVNTKDKNASGLVNALTDTASYDVTVNGSVVTVTFKAPTNSLTFVAAAQFRVNSIVVYH